MARFEFNGEEYFIDNRLQVQLDKKILPELKKKDKDNVFIVDGRERLGKSVFAMNLGAYAASQLNSEFNLSNICMNPTEFRTKIEKAQKNQVVIYDEAHRGMASSRALTEINNIMKDLMMEMGQMNLFVIIVLPTFFLLDKYAALFRSTGLFHIYENKRRRGFWVYFNRKNKLKLYIKGKKEFNYDCMKYPFFRGRFFDRYPVDEEGYREKKRKSFKSKPRISKNEVLIEQRNVLLCYLHEKRKLSSIKLEKILKAGDTTLNRRQIQRILAEFKEKPQKARQDLIKVE